MNKYVSAGKAFGILVFFTIFLTSFLSCQDEFEEIENEEPLKQLKCGELNDVEPTGTLPGGALYEIAFPIDDEGHEIPPYVWNNLLPQRILIVYAHGYRDPGPVLELPEGGIDQVGGIPVKEFVRKNLGMAWATTSFRRNGLVVKDGVKDIKELRKTIDGFFNSSNNNNPGYLPPQYIYLAGPSEGALITVLTLEKYPCYFDGAIALAGPIGNFYRQLQYFGDALLLFKYFFGETIPVDLGTPCEIHPETIAAWYAPLSELPDLPFPLPPELIEWFPKEILPAMIAKALVIDLYLHQGEKIKQFLKCSKIPVDISDLTNIETQIAVGKAIIEVLRFPIIGANDAKEVLGGCVYNNKRPYKWYTGSNNDDELNDAIERIKTEDWYCARNEVFRYYHPRGKLEKPLVTLHTTGDHIALYWHEKIYKYKVWRNRSFRFYAHIPIEGYGHYTFGVDDVMAGLTILQYKATKQTIPLPPTVDFTSDMMNKFEELMQQYCTKSNRFEMFAR